MKICKIYWKLRSRQRLVLFCKYLSNESLDLHEILCGCQFLRNLDGKILEICKMHWKLRIKQTPILLCKYLRNESSNLHEIFCGGHLLSCEFHEDPCTNARARVVNMRNRDKTCARASTTCALAFMHGSSYNLIHTLTR